MSIVYKLDTSSNPAQRTFMESQAPELLYSGAFGAGKTLIGCEKGLFLSLKYPHNIGAIIRKNFAHLRYSSMETFFRYVCPQHYIQRFDKNTSTVYLTNGSKILFLGIDQPIKIASAEFGWIFVDEAVELDEDDWIMLLGRLRLRDVPFRQIFAATNPGPPTHFLYRRFFIDMLGQVVESNTLANKFLPQDYIDRLSSLKGRYYERYVLGYWISFEGMVYDCWEPTKHLIDRFDIPDSWLTYRVIDFGYTNPFVCQFWGREPTLQVSDKAKQRPWYMYQEVYTTHKTIPDLAPLIKRLSTGRNIVATFTDWAASERELLQQEGIPCQIANKAIEPGVQEVYNQIALDQIFIFKDALYERDDYLVQNSKPVSTAEEFALYRWPEGRKNKNIAELPIDKDNHGMDCLRYLLYTVREPSVKVPVIIGQKSSSEAAITRGSPRKWSGFGTGNMTGLFDKWR